MGYLAPRVLSGLFCSLGGGTLDLALLSAGRNCLRLARKAADWLFISKGIAVGGGACLQDTELRAKRQMGWSHPDEGQHKLSLHKSKNQHTLSTDRKLTNTPQNC